VASKQDKDVMSSMVGGRSDGHTDMGEGQCLAHRVCQGKRLRWSPLMYSARSNAQHGGLRLASNGWLPGTHSFNVLVVEFKDS